METGAKQHFEDKIRICVRCSKKVLIKHNQVGGFWHLSGYEDKDRNKHYGGHCSECFDKLKENKDERK